MMMASLPKLSAQNIIAPLGLSSLAACYALTGPGSGGPWAVSGNDIFNTNTGNVGIGTTSPDTVLHVQDTGPVIILQDTASAANQAGYVGFWNNASAETGWVGFGTPGSPHFSVVNARTFGDIYLYPGPSGGAVSVPEANVGIGTEAPAAKLDVRGNIRLGNSGQFFAPAGEENLRILRGTVNFNGAILQGQGFAVTQISQGDYLVTFNTPFAGTPTVTATVDDQVESLTLLDFYVAGIFAPSANSVRIRTRLHSDADGVPTGPTNQRFHFIAVGPR